MAFAMPNDEHSQVSGKFICLEFANKWNARMDSVQGSPPGYADLVQWAESAGLLNLEEADRLRRQALNRPKDASAVTHQATNLRGVLYRIFSALNADSSPEPVDIEVLNSVLNDALPRLRLRRGGHCCQWTWSEEDDALDRMLWPVARSAADLLTSEKICRVRECASETCTWLFYDTSRNGRRKWCDMATCGNRAKAKRYYRRHQHPTDDE